MLVPRKYLIALSFFLAIPTLLAAQQPADSSACSLDTPSLTTNRPNLFNDQQEQWLGEIMAAQQESSYNLLPEKDSEYLTQLGNKLLSQLPPTPIPYHFRVYESSVFNAFSLAGGYIYLSRKLITDAKSEDEIAGVLAHEIGHIYTHQIATRYTRQFQKHLGITSLGDRNDVLTKFFLNLNSASKFRDELDQNEAEKDELHADSVGIYALMRAGYAPKAFAANLERITDNKGRNGSFLSDIMGGTSEVGLRIRTARKLASEAPEACRSRELHSSPGFLAFRGQMTSYVIDPLDTPTPGITPVKLDSPIRPGLNLVRFSPDGKYLLAQNETYVYVLSASPLKVLFRAYAPYASAAHFSPDSKHLLFHFQSLRVEDWDVASGTRSSVHELIEYRGCDQSELSPDGKFLACVLRVRDSWQLSLELFDVQSGKIVFDKSDGFVSDDNAQVYTLLTRPDWDPDLLSVAFSPDSHYMVVAAIASRLALDLTTLKSVKLGLDLGSIAQGRLFFANNSQIVYDCEAGQRAIFRKPAANVCIANFPDGSEGRKFIEGWESLSPVANGNYLVAGTFQDSIPHLVNLDNGQIFTLLKFPAADVYGKLLAFESGKGGVTVGEIGSPTVQSVDLPEAPLPYVRTVRFSADGNYLALANESRGAIWDLAANKRIILTRSFRGAWFDPVNQVYLQLPGGQLKPGQNLRFDPKTSAVADTGKFSQQHRQHLDVQVKLVSDKLDPEGDPEGDLMVYDSTTAALLWKRHFSKDLPQISQQEPGVLTLGWSMTGETAWDEILHTKPVWSSDETGDKHQGWLTETVDSKTGNILSQTVTPQVYPIDRDRSTSWYYSYLPERRSSQQWGNIVAVRGFSEDSTLYNAKTGARLMGLWGYALAASDQLGLVASRDRDQELSVYQLSTGHELLRLTLDTMVRSARFLPEKKQLLVLTSNQSLYTIDLSSNLTAAGK